MGAAMIAADQVNPCPPREGLVDGTEGQPETKSGESRRPASAVEGHWPIVSYSFSGWYVARSRARQSLVGTTSTYFHVAPVRFGSKMGRRGGRPYHPHVIMPFWSPRTETTSRRRSGPGKLFDYGGTQGNDHLA